MIIVNARFLTQKITGVQRYGIELSRKLKSLDPTIRFVAPKNIIHHDIADELDLEVYGIFTGHLWEQMELPLFLKKQGNPILLNLANTAPIFYKRKITNIHDIVFEHYPDSVSWKFKIFYQFLIPKVIKTSLHITTDSDFSKKDISQYYSVDENSFSVVHLGSSKANIIPNVQKQKIILSKFAS